MEKTIATLNRDKETPNKIRFKEETKPGQPPLVETIYLPKWLVGNAASIKVEITKLA